MREWTKRHIEEVSARNQMGFSLVSNFVAVNEVDDIENIEDKSEHIIYTQTETWNSNTGVVTKKIRLCKPGKGLLTVAINSPTLSDNYVLEVRCNNAAVFSERVPKTGDHTQQLITLPYRENICDTYEILLRRDDKTFFKPTVTYQDLSSYSLSTLENTVIIGNFSLMEF